MKKHCFITLALAVTVILGSIHAQAMTPLALENNEYSVVLLCTGDAGDYCDKGETVRDVFIFDDDEKFSIESFDDELFGLGAHGEYSESGFSFDATLEVVSDDIVDKYEVDIKGIALFSTVIAGSAEITYSTLNLTGYDKEDEATAYFFGIKK
ncbi:MAG: hypothetical protein N3B18_00825 [Desulfobacterota bacterium]|nr:hypothetical protein [Thermodesulfobacteriota bacterium]